MASRDQPFGNNPLLQPAGDGRPRKKLLIVSAVVHAVLLVAVIVLPARFGAFDVEPEPVEIVFYKPEAVKPKPIAPPEPVEPPKVDPPAPEPQPKPEPPRPEPQLQTPPPPPAPKPQPKSQPKPKQQPRPKLQPPAPKPAPPAPRPARKPQVGAFGEKPAPAPKTPPREQAVVKTGFAAESKVATPGKPQTRVVTAVSLGNSQLSVPREGTPPRPAVVQSGAFADDTPAKASAGAPRKGTVTTTGFTGDAPQDDGSDGDGRPTGSVQQGSFGSEIVQARPAARRDLPTETLDTPVEIVSKPKPRYTAEAREARIEGEVVLEVTFESSGKIEVHRIVGGLGHGLDEAAVLAAEKIEFTPARRDGEPVDYTATLRVVFKLA